MSYEDFIIALFLKVDDAMAEVKKHYQLKMHPSEIVTLAILFALKGVGNRAFYRWIGNNWLHLFPGLPQEDSSFSSFKKAYGLGQSVFS